MHRIMLMRLLSVTVFLLGASFCVFAKHKVKTQIKKSYEVLDYRQEVVFFSLTENLPDSSETLGLVKLGDTGFSIKCGLDEAIRVAKLEARKVGGNAIKILEHKPPTVMGSTCDRIIAQIAVIKNPEKYLSQKQSLSVDSSLVKSGEAIIHVYRPSGPGALISYDLRISDTTLCRVGNNWRGSFKTTRLGTQVIWAKTEARKEFTVNIEAGKEYYVRCGVTMGIAVGQPSVTLMSNEAGEMAFNNFKPTYKEDKILLNDGRVIDCLITKEDESTVYFSMKRGENVVQTSISKEKVIDIKKSLL